jgi:hypothetical protein
MLFMWLATAHTALGASDPDRSVRRMGEIVDGLKAGLGISSGVTIRIVPLARTAAIS